MDTFTHGVQQANYEMSWPLGQLADVSMEAAPNNDVCHVISGKKVDDLTRHNIGHMDVEVDQISTCTLYRELSTVTLINHSSISGSLGYASQFLGAYEYFVLY